MLRELRSDTKDLALNYYYYFPIWQPLANMWLVKYGWSELSCAVIVKCIPDFEDLAWKKKYKTSHCNFLLSYVDDNILDIME